MGIERDLGVLRDTRGYQEVQMGTKRYPGVPRGPRGTESYSGYQEVP